MHGLGAWPELPSAASAARLSTVWDLCDLTKLYVLMFLQVNVMRAWLLLVGAGAVYSASQQLVSSRAGSL